MDKYLNSNTIIALFCLGLSLFTDNKDERLALVIMGTIWMATNAIVNEIKLLKENK